MEILLTILGGAFLLFMFVKSNNYRNENYSKDCPKCGCKNVRPQTTGLKKNGESCYNYTCHKCGHEFRNW